MSPALLIQQSPVGLCALFSHRNSCLCLVVASGGIRGDEERGVELAKREESGGRVTVPLQRE